MGRKGLRYTLEKQLFYIGLVQEGQSAKSICRQYDIHDPQVQQWLERYEADGVNGLKKRRTRQTYSHEFKLEVVQKYLGGRTSYPI